jgi:hypothetical protein
VYSQGFVIRVIVFLFWLVLVLLVLERVLFIHSCAAIGWLVGIAIVLMVYEAVSVTIGEVEVHILFVPLCEGLDGFDD